MKEFCNKHFRIAAEHIALAKEEIGKCADTVYNNLQELFLTCQDEKSKDLITQALAALQFQDIITQRLDKLDSFLQMVDKQTHLMEDKRFLDEFAWENEVDQNDIDQMFNNYKG